MVSAGEIVSDVVSSQKNPSRPITNIHINPLIEGFCIEKDCSAYYIKDDIASHPKHTSYEMITSKIANAISNSQAHH